MKMIRGALSIVLAMVAAMPAAAADREEIFYIDLPGDVLSVTHGGAVGLAPTPRGIAPLPPELKTGFALTNIVRDAAGKPIGYASELEEFPGGSHERWNAWWTVVIPGRGTIFAYEVEAIPDIHRPIFAQVAQGKDWTGDVIGRVAAGPRADGNGIIVGGTGVYEGVTGSFSEWTRLTGLTVAGQMSGRMELRVRIEGSRP